MAIFFDKQQQSFFLQTPSSTYIIEIVKGRYLSHLYWGKKIERPMVKWMELNQGRASFHPNPDRDMDFSLDTMPAEYPDYGHTDLRTPAYQVQLENGSRITEMIYTGYEISAGKPKLPGLPATYTEQPEEADTLRIFLRDQLTSLEAVLGYTVFSQYDAIARWTEFSNQGRDPLRLLSAASMSLDFSAQELEMISLCGSWARERHLIRRPVCSGAQTVESRRGASGHEENPFVALCTPDTGEEQGQVWGVSLVYSGNFCARVEKDQYDLTRVTMGIQPFDFSWLLEPGTRFTTPEAVMVYSNSGFGGMSRTYHRLYRRRLARGTYRDAPRPILVNNWEATYFDFNQEKICALGDEAAALGIEMLVLDDGWFGHRDSDDSSLGDWEIVHPEKLPQGLKPLADKINGMGLKFGLWFEPEMVSPDSQLYRAHPDWCLHVPNRSRSLARRQLILDYSRKDVQDAIIQKLSSVLSSAHIEYVKWDMNRNMAEIGSELLPPERQMETAHRYILGLYRVLEELTSRFPQVLFESCSGGGGRFDPGMMYYMPQNWTSDDTDPVERLKIQYGTSLAYPASLMTAHVSASPNHQTGRATTIKFRGDVAMAGNFGYELNLPKLSQEDKGEIARQVALYKELRMLIQYGDLYRTASPFDSNLTAWTYVSEDKSQAAVFCYQVLTGANLPVLRCPVSGLDPAADYRIEETGAIISGQQLMAFGLRLPKEMNHGDFTSHLWRLTKV